MSTSENQEPPFNLGEGLSPREGGSVSEVPSLKDSLSPEEAKSPRAATFSLEISPTEATIPGQPPPRKLTSPGETTPPVDAMIPIEERSPSQPTSPREMTSPGETAPPVEALIPIERRLPSQPTSRREITSPGEEIITREGTSTEDIKNSEPNLSAEQLESLDQQRAQAFPHQPIQVSPAPLPLKTASPEAINFLASITLEDLALMHFTDRLVTVSETGKELGEFTISFQPIICEGLPGVNVTASSQGSIDNIPCGTSISAHISSKLETVELHHHEYIKLKNHSLVKETIVKKEQGGYVMTRDITMGENVKSETLSFSLTDLRGFVSEASNLVLLRIMARRNDVPDNMVFLSFDTEMQLCTSTYLNLGSRMLTIGKRECEVLSIQRIIHSEANGPMSWQCSFLPDGHLTSRVQVGSPITMRLKQLPHLRETDVEDPKQVFEKKPLNWEEDMQLYFKFMDKTEALKAEYSSYVRHHPELKCILADFLQFLLLSKPQDVLTFAAEYFSSFSAFETEQTPFLTSSKTSPFKQP